MSSSCDCCGANGGGKDVAELAAQSPERDPEAAARGIAGPLRRLPHQRHMRDVDVGKGLAIVLVVFGHVVARDHRPAGNDWYQAWNGMLYSFHMGLFFYLSGLVFWVKGEEQLGMRWRQTAARLAAAYVVFAGVVFVAKSVAALAMPVDRPVLWSWSEVIDLIAHPTRAFASFLWFIVVLVAVQGVALTMVRCHVSRGWGLALAALLHLLSVAGMVTEFLALHQVSRYLVFFLLGREAFLARGRWVPWLRRQWWVACLPLAAAMVVSPVALRPTLVGLAAVPALHALAVRLVDSGAGAWFERLGQWSLTIYLMNTLALGLARAAFLMTMGWDHWHFLVVLPVMVVAGLGLPIVVQQQLLARSAWLDRITR